MAAEKESGMQDYKKGIHSIGVKLILCTIFLLVIQYAVIFYKDWRSITVFSENQIRIMADLKYSAFNNELNTYATVGKIVLDSTALDDELIQAFADKDREKLLALTLPRFAVMKTDIMPTSSIFIRFRPFHFYGYKILQNTGMIYPNSEKQSFRQTLPEKKYSGWKWE